LNQILIFISDAALALGLNHHSDDDYDFHLAKVDFVPLQ